MIFRSAHSDWPPEKTPSHGLISSTIPFAKQSLQRSRNKVFTFTMCMGLLDSSTHSLSALDRQPQGEFVPLGHENTNGVKASR
jgi:hypothetical protein